MQEIDEDGGAVVEASFNLFNFKPPGPKSSGFIDNVRGANPYTIAAIMGPFGSGKTMACLARHFPAAMAHVPPDHTNTIRSRLVVVREDYRLMEKTTIKSMRELVMPFEDKGLVKWNNDEPKECHIDACITDPVSQREVNLHLEYVFLAISDRPAEQVFRGYEYTFAYVNEGMIPQEHFEFMMTRCGRYPNLPSRLKRELKPLTWIDFNAPNTDDWLADYFIYNPNSITGFWRQPGAYEKGAENLENLPKNYYKNMETYYSNEQDKKRFIHNQIGNRKDHKAVFPLYSDEYHSANVVVNRGLPISLSADAGLNPAIVVWQTNEHGQMVVLSELVDFDVSVERFAPKVKEHLAKHYSGMKIEAAVADPSAANRSATASDEKSWMLLMRQHSGIYFKSAKSNNWLARKNAVDAGLNRNIATNRPRLVIATRCTWLRRGLSGAYCYVEKRNQPGKFGSDPEKNDYSHVCDALQYACLEEGLGVIQGSMLKKHGQGIKTSHRGRHKNNHLTNTRFANRMSV